MGKSRRNRGSQRHDPTASSSAVKPVKPPSDPELAALREAKVLPIVKDLRSSDPKSRSAAASAVSSIIQDTRVRKLLLREHIVHTVLTQTLTDAGLESRAAGWGILQVLAQEEEPDFCVHLYRQDVLTAIEFASKQLSEKISSQDPVFQKLPKTEQAFLLSIASSILSLLTALAEAGDDILEAISANATITTLLFQIIPYDQGNEDGIARLRSDALACLILITEDNTKLAGRIVGAKTNTTYQALLALKDQLSGEGVLACGILHNIFVALQGLEYPADVPMVDDSALIPTLAKAVASISAEQPASNGAEGWSDPLEAQQLALEILASIGTGLSSVTGESAEESGRTKKKKARKHGKAEPPAEEEGADEAMGDADDDDINEDEEEGDDDDEMDDDEMQADMDMVTGPDDADPSSSSSLDDLPVLQALLQLALPELARVATLQNISSPSTMQLQGLALSALNNIAWSLSLVDFSAASTDRTTASILRAWRPASFHLWTSVVTPILATDTADLDLATRLTGLAWALARSFHAGEDHDDDGEAAGESPLQPGEHRRFISLYQATRSPSSGAAANNDDHDHDHHQDPFQGLGVKCIGVLGQLALLQPPAVPLDVNRDIGTFLVTVVAALPADTPPADAVEALNQLFDIYADEDSPRDRDVFWRDGFLRHLEEALPKARAMVKSVDKRSHPELRERADEAVLNLSRFLAYKRKHKPQDR